MKRIRISVLLVFLTIFVSACGGTPSPTEPAEGTPSLTEPAGGTSSPTEPAGDTFSPAEAAKVNVGDIILADGAAVNVKDLTAVDSSNFPIAVIAGYREDGTILGVGVNRSDVPLQWAADDSAGYAIRFTDAVCAQKSEFSFTGDKDGSDNWDVICSREGEDTKDDERYYPAFHFVNTYAVTQGLTGAYASGWYMPSIEELCEIYQNREAVNRSLQKIHSLDSKAAMDGLDTNWYWSSSQAGAEDDYAWFVHYFNGYAGECPKNFTNVHVLAVRAF